MNTKKLIYFTFAIGMLFKGTVSGQGSVVSVSDTGCVSKDIGDVFRDAFHKPPKVKNESSPSLILLPIVSTNPATGFILGVGGQYAFKVPGSTLYSSVMGSAQFTSKKQMIIMLKNNIYSRGNKLFFNGDWRYLIYSQPTYGLGTDAPEGGILDYQYGLMGNETGSDSLAQPMKFRFIRLHQSMSFRVSKGVYAGLGYIYDGYNRIVDEKLSLVPGDTLLTSHYLFNTSYGFKTDSYFFSGLNAGFLMDTRDNMINAYKGIYARATWRGGFKFLGNDKTVNYLDLEWRSYHGLSKSNPRHLLALWMLGTFSKTGQLPYLILPATAYDQRGRSARGYVQGRFRGPNYLYGEAEYRFPISRCSGVLGGVVFVNATTTDNIAKSLELFEAVRAGYGFGLRVMADKSSRTNFAFDLGFGKQSFGFYLAASETF